MRTCAIAGAAGLLAAGGIGCKQDDGDDDAGSGCPFTIDENNNVRLDLNDCGELLADNTAIRLDNTPLGRPLLVTHTSGESYFALDSRCTHQGCTVAASTPTLNCPCHGSKFNLTGTVNQGPAASPLREIPLTKQGSVLIIEL
ncbi:ubiquinol-cytochrome c reductase iron-sulfur subunit [candidate division KSB1 bacterium]|nr:ubiquinol-cytochrome c reductase iron-sulfur subunit [candidate division KSB1 bacterium]